MSNEPTMPLPGGALRSTSPAADRQDGSRHGAGRMLGAHYRLERLLGRGGCGSVYLADDLSLGRKVAIKMLGAGGESPGISKDSVQRFMREARAIASVEHPSIVPVYGVGQDGEDSYIVMQYVAGQTLAERLATDDALSLADALLITRQVAAALDAAHRLGMVHRDIKPSNIMIDRHGYVKVMDFGLARGTGETTAITHTGMFVGTPSYSSPEQCVTNAVDQRSDLYSLGVILYEMLAGQTPHSADTPLMVMHQIVHEPPPPLRERNPDVPEEVARIVEQLLAKNPDDRYDSAASLMADLQACLDGLKERAPDDFHPTIQLPTSTRSQRRVPSRHPAYRWLLALAAMLVLSGVLLAAVLVMRDKLPAATTTTTAAAEIPAGLTVGLAIYDFANATASPQLDWLELGLPDMLAASLGQHPFISLKTRNDIFWHVTPRPERFDDRLRAMLPPLGVEVIAKGNVYRDGDQLRFVVHLLSLDEQRQLGIAAQHGTVDNVFGAIDELASQIINLLQRHSARSERHVSDQPGRPAVTAQTRATGIMLARKLSLPEEFEKARIDRTLLRQSSPPEQISPHPDQPLDKKTSSPSADTTAPGRDYEGVLSPPQQREHGEISDIGAASKSVKSEAAMPALTDEMLAGLQAAMPYYYRGRQILAATCADQDDFSAQAQALFRALIAVADHPDRLAPAYEQWQAKRQAPDMP